MRSTSGNSSHRTPRSPQDVGASAAFCERVRHLVDAYDGGNVTAAARRLDVPQRTLAKVYIGETDEPRLALIRKLVESYPMEDARWIVAGERTSSVERFEAAARAHAIVLLRRIIADLANHPPGGPDHPWTPRIGERRP